MPLSDAERAFLSTEWRYAESSDANIKVRHPGAREGEYTSPFITEAGAVIALNIIAALTTPTNRVLICTIPGVVNASFKGRPRTVRLYHKRFGGDPVLGQLFMVEACNIDYGAQRTTLHLIG